MVLATRPTARYRRVLSTLLGSFLLATLFLVYVRLVGSESFIPEEIRSIIPLGLKKSWPADRPMAQHFVDTARPALVGFPDTVKRLDVKHIPMAGNGRRLVIVGDVHGMIEPLQHLLYKVHFRGVGIEGLEKRRRPRQLDPVEDKLSSVFDDMSLADSRGTDHLILVGDMINKGPSSAEVIDFAMRLGASAVRGNHEDRVLLERAALNATRSGAELDVDQELEDLEDPEQQILHSNLQRGDPVDRETAASLTDPQLDWLASLPAILDLGFVQGFHSTGRLVVAHAGLVPSPLPLESQDPWAAMNIRSLVYPREDLRRKEALDALLKAAIDAFRRTDEYLSDPDAWTPKRLRKTLRANISDEEIEAEFRRRTKPSDRDVVIPSDGHDGEPWTYGWEDAQRAIPQESGRTTVVYGHDSKLGLREGPYSIGLDSGCVRGRELSALVIEATADGVKHEIVSVKCKKPSKKGKHIYGKDDDEE